MMRSPDLAFCLESPFLWYDPAASALVPKDLESAAKLLKEAPEKKDAIDQLNAAYQSMFCGSQALIHAIQYKVWGFRCVVTVLEEYYVKKGKLDQSQVESLAKTLRLEGPPAENIALAASFLEAVKKALEK